ncbi:MAG TPA: glycosyltransferase family 39 protein [Candidatus Dormibacteraeota bacterium]|nr:glycosyltransferase family 39 protein [Candidatus Dormibacteraeota bacterium]
MDGPLQAIDSDPLIVRQAPPGGLDARAILLFGGAAVAIIAVHLATNGNLGFHTDELYYLDCGRHPAFGYADFPPIVPLLARLETGLLGVTPWTLRLLPALISGILVVLFGAYVRRLGGSLWLQGIGLLIGLTVPFLLGTWLFQTVIFDQLTWMVSLYWFLLLILERKAGYWILLGITLGIGLEVKHTILGLIIGIGVAVLLTPSLRKDLRTRYPWFAVGLMVLIWAPNILWQIGNGFPTVAYVVNHRGSTGGTASYLEGLLLLLFFLLPLWIAGFLSLFRNPGLRPIGIACAIPLVLFLFAGKYYYAAATMPIVMAQGLLAVSHLERRRLRSGLTVAVVVASLLALVLVPITVPVVPASRLHATKLDSFYGDTVGWPEVAQQVTAIYSALPQSEQKTTVIISAYYGVPGALAVYGNPKLLPDVISPQLSDWFWLPKNLTATDALMVDYTPSDVAWMCDSPTLIAHLTVPYQVVSLEQNAPVTLCHLKAPIPGIWSQLRNFS